MLKLGLLQKLVRLTKTSMCNTRSTVQVRIQELEFQVGGKGFKQGDGLAPILFNLAGGSNKRDRSGCQFTL